MPIFLIVTLFLAICNRLIMNIRCMVYNNMCGLSEKIFILLCTTMYYNVLHNGVDEIE